jgi:putative CocE/NonD family hydrolase
VKAVVPTFAVWDTYSDHFYPGGLLLSHLPPAYGALTRALDLDLRDEVKQYAYFADPRFEGPAPVDEDKDCRLRDQAVIGHTANVDVNDFIREFAFRDSGLSYDPDYTSATISPYNFAEQIRPETAYYCISGWMDGGGYGNASVKRFLSLRNERKHLLLGPWDHGARTNVSPFREAVAPQFKLLAECLRFFDHYLKGIETGLDQERPVHYFTMAEEAWKSADSWPIPTAEDLTFYLGANGTLSQDRPNEAEAADQYQTDQGCGTGPHTRYERLSAKVVEQYYKDWHGRDSRMLTYTTSPLDRSVEVSGHPLVDLFVSSTERDGAFFVYLEDVEADGTCRYVTEGVFRAIHRKISKRPWNHQEVGPHHSFRKADAELLAPLEPAQISFALFPTSWLFRKGHRIRIALATADRDHYLRIPGGRTPMLRYFRNRDLASRIVLPVIR